MIEGYSFWRKLFRITLPTILLLFLISEFVVCRFLLPASEWPYRYSIKSGDDAARYLYKDSGMYREGVHRLGFPERYAGHYTINHEGWNSTREYTSAKSGKTRIAVIGDSFVDALQVNVEKCFAEILGKTLGPSVEVYRFGFGAAPMTQYLQVLRYARDKFHPDVAIVSIQANDFLASIYGYGNENGDFLQVRPDGTGWIEIKPVAYKPNGLRLATKQSAIFRYFYGNLGFRSRAEILNSLFKRKQEEVSKYRMNVDIQENLAYLETYRSLCLYVFGQMKQAIEPHGKLLLFMDTDRAAIYESIDPRTEEVYKLNETVSQAAKELKIPFVDLTADFENDYKLHRHRFDFDIDNHWNEKGHQLVADALTRFLKKAQWF